MAARPPASILGQAGPLGNASGEGSVRQGAQVPGILPQGLGLEGAADDLAAAGLTVSNT